MVKGIRMPRTRSLAWAELKIGVLTIAAVVITAVTIFFLTGDRGFPWQRYSLKTRFANVAGLKAGSPVRVAGLDVGTVTDVALAGEQVDVTFEVSQEVRDRITTEFGGDARLGVAARRERGRHHRVGVGHADPRVGLRSAGTRGGAVHRSRQRGRRRGREPLRAHFRHPRWTRNRRQADDRRSAVRRAESLRRQRQDAHRQLEERPRHARAA